MSKARVAFLTIVPDDMLGDILGDVPPQLDLRVVRNEWPEEEKVAACRDVEFMMTGVAAPSPQLLRACPRLRFLQLFSAGFDFLDLDVIAELGIVVSNNGGSNAIAVAEITILLMLAVYRQLDKQWQTVDAKGWLNDLDPMKNHELLGKTVGIIGLGNIGRQVAQRLNGWAGRVLYYDVVDIPPEVEKRLNVERVALDSLLVGSDIVTVHVPYNQHTHHMLGKREFSLMKPSAVFINTCRGGVVDEPALARALRENRIAAAGLDVFEQEPVEPDNPLLDMENVFPLPHRAGASIDTFRRSATFGFENILRVMRGEEPLSQVWPPRE